MTERTDGDLKILAMVRFNNEWAYVFNRPTRLLYREEVIDGRRYLVGRDGPICSFLAYGRDPHSKAFAGRELNLLMEDGSVRIVKDVWWSCASPLKGMTRIPHSDQGRLRTCYVFSACYCEQEALDAMIHEYEERRGNTPFRFPDGGYRYPYWEYEKVLRYDSDTRRLREEVYRLERDKKNLIAEARRQAQRAAAMAEGGEHG